MRARATARCVAATARSCAAVAEETRSPPLAQVACKHSASPLDASRTWTLPDSTCVCGAAASRRLRSLGARQVPTLRKYRRAFKIGEPQQFGTKDELLPAVVRHWQNQVRLVGDAGGRLRALSLPARRLSTRMRQYLPVCSPLRQPWSRALTPAWRAFSAVVFALRKQAQAGGASPGLANKLKQKPTSGVMAAAQVAKRAKPQ